MVFLSLSDLSISMHAGSEMDDGTHLRTKKQAILTEILRTGFVAGLFPAVQACDLREEELSGFSVPFRSEHINVCRQ